jgi:site-specific DNA-methyltransferase (adenine-specific)
MHTIPILAIRIPPERQRTDIPDEHIGELMSTVFGPAGLINPVVLREGETLVAGECRVRAIKLGYAMGKTLFHAGQEVPQGEIPYIDFGELSVLQQMEIEYAENAFRQDLTWQDNARALDQLHALRQAQAAQRGEVHLIKHTAQEVFKRSDGDYGGKVSSSILVAKHLDNPAIAGAKSLKEAQKILVRQDEKVRRETLATLVGKQSISERFQVYNADCLEWMASQPADQFDVILTDPPYGMAADQFNDAAGKMVGIDHEYSDDRETTQILLAKAIPEFFRLAKPEAHLYLWCDLDLFHWLREQCQAAGWWTHRTPLINVKPDGGRVPWPEHGPRRSYELVLYAVKGKKPVTSIRNDTFESKMPEGNLGHGAQKPIEAYVELLKRSVRPGDRVLDAFAGSGVIFPAAAAVQCSAVGIELAPHAYGICLERIKELT